MSASETSSDGKPAGARARRLARVAAVQALYQMDLAQTDLNDVIGEFMRHRFGHGEEEGGLADADTRFFDQLLRGVVRRQLDIDPVLDDQLASGWRLTRIDSTLRAILRAGTFELLERTDVPLKVAINEYIEVAREFFEGDEVKVVNGVLDALAKRLRPETG